MLELNTQTFLYPVFSVLYQALGPDSWFAGTTIFFAQWFPFVLVIIPIVYELFLRDKGWGVNTLMRIYTAPVVAYIFTATIKFLYPSPRPFASLEIPPLITGENPYGSFPSSHAAFFAALGIAMYFVYPKLGKWFLFGALLIGIARIGAGIHWPIDILSGFILGLGVGFVAEMAFRIWAKHKGQKS